MSLVGVDLNSSRARAVAGSALQRLTRLPLEGEHLELPLLVSLETPSLRIGQAGLALARRRPHLVCGDFLPYLGSSKQWLANRHRLDADAALLAVFQTLSRTVGRTVGLGFVLPAYLNELQIARIYQLAQSAGLPLLGSLNVPLAAVLAQGSQIDQGFYLVVDADSYALSWSVVERTTDQLRVRLVQPNTALSRTVWIRRLLEGVAGRCVRQVRRDPRESAETEQRLYEQLLRLLEKEPTGLVQLHVQGEGWYHHLMLHTEELTALVAPQLRQLAIEIDSIRSHLASLGRSLNLLVTPQAACLPGMMQTLQRNPSTLAADNPADFGESLLANSVVSVLSADMLAGVAHQMAARIYGGELPSGHLDAVGLPVLPGIRLDVGPARLAYAGQDHVLMTSPFTLGRDPACHLVFATEQFPHVSARHCDIVLDQFGYVLHDRSRHGTLLNERPVQQAALSPGDWIRLGPTGPVLRFLGQPTERPSCSAAVSR
jgi:hypothetical protein